MSPQTAPLQDVEAVRARILFLCILKFALITAILAAGAITYWLAPRPHASGTLLHGLVIGLVVFEYLTLLGILALLYRRSSMALRIFFISIAADVLLTTLLVHLTGYANSPYVVLYMVGIISAAVVMPLYGALLVTLASIGLYLAVAVLGNAGMLAQFGSLGVTTRLNASELASRLGIHGSAMAAVAALAATLARHILRVEEKQQDQNRQIRILFNRHQDILRSLSDGVLSVSEDGRILDVNPAFCRLLDVHAGVGDSVGVLPAPILEWIEQRPYFLHTLYSLGENTLELEVSVQDLQVDGQRTGAIVVVRDRSEQARLERDLARKEKLAALGRLTASIAHEIRNPLTSIAGSLELLRPAATQANPENQELFDIVFREIRRLNDLIKELRQYTSERKRTLEPLDLVESAKETIKLCESDSRTAVVRLKLDAPASCTISYDPDGLRQVLLNLLLNAIQAAAVSSDPAVVVRIEDHEKEVHVDIEDTGSGIPPELQEKIFEPFVSTKQSGTGLGLAIASQIALSHGGRIQLLRSDASGTCMRFVILRKN